MLNNSLSILLSACNKQLNESKRKMFFFKRVQQTIWSRVKGSESSLQYISQGKLSLAR